jgi:hypothetical protein
MPCRADPTDAPPPPPRARVVRLTAAAGARYAPTPHATPFSPLPGRNTSG